nr:methyltransferase domain-containing protein [bacterium]
MAYEKLAPVYDRWMRSVDYDAWADFIWQAFDLQGDGPHRVCDVACGTGAIACRLARRGARVTGVDASADMLAVAQQNARAMGVRVDFALQDMRALSLHRPQDGICAVCDGLNYITDPAGVEAFFARAYGALLPGARLVFDVSTPYKLEHVLGNRTFGDDGGAAAYVWENVFDAKSRLISMKLAIFVREGDGRYRRMEERHLQRAHSRQELTQALQKAGFSHIEVLGDDRRSPAGERDERWYFVAGRA